MRKFVKKILTKKGESLTEVIIAVGILMMILAPAAGLYIASNRASEVSQKSLIAHNLAQEGLDLVRGFRDTNLLRYKTKQKECWLSNQDLIDPNVCQNFVLLSGSYTVENADLGAKLMRLGNENNLSDTLAAQSDPPYNLRLGATGIYSPTATPGDVPSVYYREVNLTLADLNDDGVLNATRTDADRVKVVVKVKFPVGSKVQTVIASEYLYAVK